MEPMVEEYLMVMAWVMLHPMEVIHMLPTEPILMVPLALAGAWALAPAGVEAWEEEDGSKIWPSALPVTVEFPNFEAGPAE